MYGFIFMVLYLSTIPLQSTLMYLFTLERVWLHAYDYTSREFQYFVHVILRHLHASFRSTGMDQKVMLIKPINGYLRCSTVAQSSAASISVRGQIMPGRAHFTFCKSKWEIQNWNKWKTFEQNLYIKRRNKQKQELGMIREMLHHIEC